MSSFSRRQLNQIFWKKKSRNLSWIEPYYVIVVVFFLPLNPGWIAVTKGSSATRDNNHRHQSKQQQQQTHNQETMSNDDETTIGKNQTSILKQSHRYVLSNDVFYEFPEMTWVFNNVMSSCHLSSFDFPIFPKSGNHWLSLPHWIYSVQKFNLFEGSNKEIACLLSTRLLLFVFPLKKFTSEEMNNQRLKWHFLFHFGIQTHKLEKRVKNTFNWNQIEWKLSGQSPSLSVSHFRSL